MSELIGFLGIDVSKGYANFELLNESKEVLLPGFKHYDTSSGHASLLSELSSLKSAHGLTKIVCGVESTGGYENNWYRSLHCASSELGLEVYRLNPVGVAYQGKSELRRTITDSVSAQMISSYLCDKYEQLGQVSPSCIDSSAARKFYHYIESLLKEKTRLSNQIEKLIYNGFPELIRYMKNGLPNWLLRLLDRYPGSGPIKRAKVASLAKINGITLKKAEQIHAKAQKSIGQDDSLFLNRAIQGIARQIIELTQRIKTEKLFLEKNYTSPEVELLADIKGIGKYTAIGAMMEIEDVKKYKSASSMAAFFGVYPEMKTSGDGTTKPRMSKKGRVGFRSLIYMGARNVVLHNPYFKKIFARFRAKGMTYNQAIGVIMNKLTRVFFGILKSGKPFDPKIDQENQKKNQQKSTKIKQKNQTPGAVQKSQEQINSLQEAPCSRRAYKKNMAELLPQTSIKEVNTRSGNST